MTDDLDERIQGVLDDAESSLDSLADEDQDELLADEDHSLREVADDAAALIADTDSESLLEALSLSSLPDGSEPESIPQAIAEGDSEKVATLQALTKLSKLSKQWDGGDEDAFGDGLEAAREAVETESDLLEGETDRDESTDESADGSTADDEATGDEAAEEAAAEDEAAEDEDAGLGDSLQSAVDGAFDGFGDDLRDAKTQLEGLIGDEEGADEAKADADDETDADKEAEEDDGLLGGSSSSGSKRHSTVAPSPSERADMKAVKRHSTMPDRDSRRDMND